MNVEITKFIPPEMRLEITQKIIEERGIRPLAREIGVNPKSVYKYKQGEAHPTDEVMVKILAIAKREDPVLLDKYLSKLRESFSRAIGVPIEPKEILTSPEESPRPTPKPSASSEGEEGVDQGATDQTADGSSDGRKPTEGGITLNEIYDRIEISDLFNRSKVQKILNSLTEDPNLDLDELVERTGLSKDALEKYLEMLISGGILESDSSGTYKLSTKIEG